MVTKILTALALLLASFAVSAEDTDGASYCQANKLGWHFHCDTPKKKKEVVKAAPKPAPAQTARQQLDDMNVLLEEAKAKAVLDPSADNLKAYILLHQDVLNRAGDFADSWRRTLWANPDMDYLVSNPISSAGKGVWQDQRKAEKEAAAAEINEQFGVFFFYLSTCPVCHKYGPILKSFAERFNITVQAVRLDEGADLPGWPGSWVDNGQWDALGLTGQSVPMTVLFNKDTKEVTKIGVGVMTHDQLLNRIFVLTKTEVGDVF